MNSASPSQTLAPDATTEPLVSSLHSPRPVRWHLLFVFVLLAAFVGQCCWFVFSVPLTQLESNQILRGLATLRRIPTTEEAVSSPLVPLLSVAAIAPRLAHGQFPDQFYLDQHRWFIRAPFMLAGLALALSLWYIARRFYGNAGGLIALALYAFSPGIVACSSLALPQIFAAWGAFGLIFTALATAHTLYAPREVILWNWKRILLLGVSITFAVGAQWPLAWLLIPAAAFMLWAVPHRRGAAIIILAASIAVAAVLLDLCYLANLHALGGGLLQTLASPLPLSPSLLVRILSGFFLENVPGTLLAFPVALGVWCVWPRARFFGNSAPLIVFVLLLAMSLLFPQSGASALLFATFPFLILFVAGVLTDAIEGRAQAVSIAFVFAVIFAQAAYSIVSLMRMYSRLPGS
jgi:hypothetical protein